MAILYIRYHKISITTNLYILKVARLVLILSTEIYALTRLH
jgi:hypothetical protein